VKIRRAKKEKQKEERALAIEAAAEREKQKAVDMETALAEFEAQIEAEMAEEEEESSGESPNKKNREIQQFDEIGFLKKWEETNPRIIVPDEVYDDIDNDFDIEISEENE
jgi:hypothetical protein